jgi:hypothetical protein
MDRAIVGNRDRFSARKLELTIGRGRVSKLFIENTESEVA